MKPEPETLRSNADGSIPAQPFTGEQSTLFPKTYLSGPPVYDRLREEEAIQYLLVNQSFGLTIDVKGSAKTTTHTPDSDLHSLAAVTDCRVLFLTGQSDGDRTVSLCKGEITGASIKLNMVAATVYIETEARTYSFPVRKRASSSPAAAVSYVQEHLVPSELSTESNKKTQADAAPAGQADTDPQQVGSDSGSAFITNERQLAEETRERLRTAAKHNRAVDAKEDELNEVIESLETAKEEFRSIAEDSGIHSQKVNGKIESLESSLKSLYRIRSAISEGNRKLTILEESSRIPTESLEDTRSTIKEAIDVANKMGRTPKRLEELLEQIKAGIESMTGQSERETNTTETSAEQQPSGEKSQKADSSDSAGSDRIPNQSHNNNTGQSISQAHVSAEKSDDTAKEADAAAPADQKDADGNTDAAEEDNNSVDLDQLSGVDAPTAEALRNAGYDSISEVCAASQSELSQVEGVDGLLASLIKTSTENIETPEEVEKATQPLSTDESESSKADTSTDTAAGNKRPKQNELSERYELIRNLRKLCKLVIEVRAEATAEGNDSDPIISWEKRVDEFYCGDLTDDDSYGAQQAERNPFSIAEYRNMFGTGQRTTEFEHVQVRPLTASVRALLAPHTDVDFEAYRLPVDTETGARFPIIIESQAELERATEMLDRLPSHPEPAATDHGEGGLDEDEQDEANADEAEPQTTTDRSGNGTSEKPEAPLTEIHGITDSIAQSLQHAGYQTRDDLQDASVDDLAAVDGVGEQVAMRIVINVGE